MKTILIETIKTHWKKQGGKLRGYTLDNVELYAYDKVFNIQVTGPKGKLQQDAYDKIKQMFSDCSLEGGAGYIGVGGWSELRPNIRVNVPIDAELIDLEVRTTRDWIKVEDGFWKHSSGKYSMSLYNCGEWYGELQDKDGNMLGLVAYTKYKADGLKACTRARKVLSTVEVIAAFVQKHSTFPSHWCNVIEKMELSK